MKHLYTKRLKTLVDEAGVSHEDLAIMAEVSLRRITDALSPRTEAINLNLDTLVRLSVVLSVYLTRDPEDVFYDIIEDNLASLDALWKQSDKNPNRQVALRKLGGA